MKYFNEYELSDLGYRINHRKNDIVVLTPSGSQIRLHGRQGGFTDLQAILSWHYQACLVDKMTHELTTYEATMPQLEHNLRDHQQELARLREENTMLRARLKDQTMGIFVHDEEDNL